MPYISQITLPTGGTYVLKDAQLRAAVGIKDYAEGVAYSKNDYLFYNGKLYIVNADITELNNTQFSDVNTTETTVNDDIKAKYNELKELIAGGVQYRGYTTTELADGDTTNPITINGELYTAHAGDLVIYAGHSGSAGPQDRDREFIFNDTMWNEFGSTGVLKALAFADTASGSLTNGTASVSADYTPRGSVSVTLTDDSTASNVSFTRGNYTPEGTIKVTNPTIAIASGSTGDVTVITGVANDGTDTINKVTAGTQIKVATKAANPTTVGNADVDTAVTVATGLKTGEGYATTFTTNGIKSATIAEASTGAEFNVPTNAISDVTLTSSATTSTGAVSYLEGTALKDKTTYTGYDTEFLNNVTVNGETLVIGKANVGLVNTTKYMTAPTTAAVTKGYKVATESANTARVDVDTDSITPAKAASTEIYSVGDEETITPAIVGDAVTVIKSTGLDSTKLGATATNGSATFVGKEEADLKVTGGTYYKQVVGNASFAGTQDTIDSTGTATGTVTVTPDKTQSGE